MTGTWLAAPNSECDVVDGVRQSIDMLFVGRMSACPGRRLCRDHGLISPCRQQPRRLSVMWSVDDAGADLSHAKGPRRCRDSSGVCSTSSSHICFVDRSGKCRGERDHITRLCQQTRERSSVRFVGGVRGG